MSTGRDLGQIVQTARDHYMHLKSDISNAKDRVEHIRLTAFAQEAHNLLTDLIAYETGLEPQPTFNENQDPLDLPEFKSPYNPDA